MVFFLQWENKQSDISFEPLPPCRAGCPAAGHTLQRMPEAVARKGPPSRCQVSRPQISGAGRRCEEVELIPRGRGVASLWFWQQGALSRSLPVPGSQAPGRPRWGVRGPLGEDVTAGLQGLAELKGRCGGGRMRSLLSPLCSGL